MTPSHAITKLLHWLALTVSLGVLASGCAVLLFLLFIDIGPGIGFLLGITLGIALGVLYHRSTTIHVVSVVSGIGQIFFAFQLWRASIQPRQSGEDWGVSLGRVLAPVALQGMLISASFAFVVAAIAAAIVIIRQRR